MSEVLRQLKQRKDKARQLADQQLSDMREAYRYLIPERFAQMQGGSSNNENVNNTQRFGYSHVFDSTGMQALSDGASQIAEAIHPFDQEWFRWTPRLDINPAQREQVQQWGDAFTRIAHSLLNRSNADTEFPKAHKDFLINCGFLEIQEDPDEPGRIRFTAVPAYLWAIEEGWAGKVTGKFRVMKPKGRELPYLFDGQGNYSAKTQKQASKDPEAEVTLHVAYTWDPKRRVECLTVFEDGAHDTDGPVHYAEYTTPPVICYRSNCAAGQVWGAGPGLQALPDVKLLNKVVELTLKNAAIAVSGIWQADDDGVLNPANIKLTPGSIIPKAAGSAGLQPLEAPGDFKLSFDLLEMFRVSVRRAFYVTRVEEREMTAEEYAGRVTQQAREMRGAYGQLRAEFAEPVVRRVLDLGYKMGALEKRPDLEALTQMELTGPLAQSMKQGPVDRERLAAGMIAQIAGPQAVMAAQRYEEMIPYIVAEIGARAENWQDKAGLVKIAAQVTQALMQQQQAA